MKEKELILVGDKVLVLLSGEEEKTEAGLYLPQGVREKEKVLTGRVIKTGPGYPVVDPSILEEEPWRREKNKIKYFPLQAREGDFCIFLKEEAVEIEFEKKKYMVVPQSAILLLVRDVSPEEIK